MTEAEALQHMIDRLQDIVDTARRVAFLGGIDHDDYIVNADVIRELRHALKAYDVLTGNDTSEEV